MDEFTEDAAAFDAVRRERDVAQAKLTRATALLREWRDEYGGKAVVRIVNHGTTTAASPTDLLRDTQRFLENR